MSDLIPLASRSLPALCSTCVNAGGPLRDLLSQGPAGSACVVCGLPLGDVGGERVSGLAGEDVLPVEVAGRLDGRLFMAPFVLVGADNRRVGSVGSVGLAWARLGRGPAVAVVGTLVGDAWAVDVDPGDVAAEPEAGEALADGLRAWCEDVGVPVLVRASGRPGGRHVVAVLPGPLLGGFREVVAVLAAHHGVAATVRKSLRLLSSPHRNGLPAPVLSSTLQVADLPDPAERPGRSRRRGTSPDSPPTPGSSSGSSS